MSPRSVEAGSGPPPPHPPDSGYGHDDDDVHHRSSVVTTTTTTTTRGRATSIHQDPPPSRRGRRGMTVHWPFQSIVTTDNLSLFSNGHLGGFPPTRPGTSSGNGNGPELFRRATWQPPRLRQRSATLDSGTTSLRDSTLIPDYVVNFIRGETPETVARRKKNGGYQASRVVDMTHQHRPQRSYAALFEDARRAEEEAAAMEEIQKKKSNRPVVDVREYAARGWWGNDLSRHPTHATHATHTTSGSETRHMLANNPADGDSDGEKKRRRRRRRRRNGSGGGGGGSGGWKSLTTGWRSGVVLTLVLVLILLLAGFVCLVVAGTQIALLVGDMDLYTGNGPSCLGATAWTWGLHALINVAVVVVLIGAHYVFQVLSSPTRAEVAAAHQRRAWLEIGVPSARNFAHIGKGRVVLALLLLTVAVVTQIIYNALIFTSETAPSYNLIAVEASFLTGGPFSNASSNNAAGLARKPLQEVQGAALAGELANLTVPECVHVLTGAFNSEYQSLLLVLQDYDDDDDNINTLVATARAGLGESAQDVADISNSSATSSSETILVNGAPVQYCLGQAATAAQATCTVQLNGVLLAVVLGLHLITLLGTAASLLLARFDNPLVTLGDALASFLRDPDPTTRHNGLLTKENLRTNMGGWGFTEGKYWVPQRDHRWFRSASLTQWLVAGIWWILTLCPAAGILALTLASSTITSTSSSPSSAIPKTTTTITLTPFGVPNTHTTYLISARASAQLSAPLLAIICSLPQLLLAGLYFSTNALLTAFFLTRESSRYAILLANAARRPLRVSADPQGHQTTSLYLTLPRPVSWGLAVWFAAMGFVLSQSCFVVSLTSATHTTTKLLGVGFSSTGLLVLVLMLLALLLVVLGLAFLCKAPAAVQATGQAIGNPLVFEGGSCSAVMSARCHRLPGETDVEKGYLCWGVVPEMGDAPRSHVTYSARPLMEMDGHHRYV